MSPSVTFKKLWLASERTRRAREIDLSAPKTLLLGPNGTGKSRILKNAFWALGCEPRKWGAGAWDPNTVAALEVEVEGNTYTVVRSGRQLGVFDLNGRLKLATSNRSAWMDVMGTILGYELKLQRPNSEAFHAAGVTYLTLPYYIDQDGSWGATWNTYADLTQFQNWRKPVFEAFTGLRPAAYLEAKQRRDELKLALRQRETELDAQHKAFERIQKELPKNLPSLDVSRFRAELTELANTSKRIQAKQIDARARVTRLVAQTQQLRAELQLAVGAHKELVADLSYLSDIPDSSNIECPTCGTKHQTSFHARLGLAGDAESMSALVLELKQQLDVNRKEESALRHELREIDSSLKKIGQVAEQRRARVKLDDVLNAYSKRNIDQAFGRVTAQLHEAMAALRTKTEDVEQTIKKYDDRQRQTEVSSHYKNQLQHLSDVLNIPADESVDETKIGARPVSGGSSGPRAVLAVHLSMLATNVAYGDTARFPFVVDTPQQSGQDENNLARMIDTITRYSGDNHQIILAVERLPEVADISGYNVLRLTDRMRLLRESEFSAVAERLRDKLFAIREEEIKSANNEARATVR